MAHGSRLNYQPSTQGTWDVLHQCFWWATLEEDTRGFVKSCTICSQHKPSHQAPSTHLQPLLIPHCPGSHISHCPGSHISLDSATSLPASRNNLVILSVVYRLSKMTHFVPLPKLPSTKERVSWSCLMLLHNQHNCVHLGFPLAHQSNLIHL